MKSRHRVAGGACALVLAAAMLAANAVVFAGTETSAEAPAAHAAKAAAEMPVFSLVEGAKASPYPYTPHVLKIPAGMRVALSITDHLGGCGLVTVFPKLGPNGETVRARVPVGQTRQIVIRAPKPGRYRYGCAANMFFGVIEAN